MTKENNKMNAPVIKSGLAKLLAQENISVRHVLGLTTANFDVHNRTLNLPVWKDISDDLYDMFVIHEVGHALETPSKSWQNGIEDFSKAQAKGDKRKEAIIASSFHGFQNVLEDVRIDKLQRKRYPGSKRNYVIGMRELFERDFFGLKDRKIKDLAFIDRLNIHYKAGFSGIYVPFTKKEKEFLQKVESLVTFEDVVELSKDLWVRTKKGEFKGPGFELDEAADIDPDALMGEGGDGNVITAPEDEDEDEDTAAVGSAPPGENDPEDDSDSDTDAEDDSDSEEEDEEDEEELDTTGMHGGSGKAEPKEEKDPEDEEDWEEEEIIPEATTSESLEEAIKALSMIDGTAFYYATFPKVIPNTKTKKLFTDYKKVLAQHKDYQVNTKIDRCHLESLLKWKKSENQTISFMVKEFEMRQSAVSYSKTAVAKTGVIDTNKLHSYRYSDDIFKRVMAVPKGKSHGFVMFIDWSGSMDTNLKGTVMQLFSLMLFCRRIQVPFEVFSFTNGEGGPEFLTSPHSLAMYARLQIRNLFSSRMNSAEFNQALLNLWAFASSAAYKYNPYSSPAPEFERYLPAFECTGGTPLNETILAATSILKEFKIGSKVDITNVIFLTDGEGGRCQMPSNIRSNAKAYRVILQDDVTKNEYMLPEVQTRSDNLAFDWTNAFLRMLKDRTGCNLVGFYIHEGGYGLNTVIGQGKYIPDSQFKEMKKKFKEQGHFPIMNSGYDEYFLIYADSMELGNDDFQVESKSKRGPSTGMITKEFAKFMKNKTLNRVLLTNFIKKIA
jgi:hypothetical protein